MSAVMILFAFTLSLVINFIERKIHPADNNIDAEINKNSESFAVEESE